MLGILAGLVLAIPDQTALEFRRIEPLTWGERPTVAVVAGGRLLVGTRSGGLYQLKSGAKQLEPIAGPPKTKFVISITQGNRCAIIGTGLGEGESEADPALSTWIVDDGSDKAQAVQGIPNDAMVECAAQFGRRLLLGTSTYGLWTLEDRSTTASHIAGPPNKDGIRSISVQGGRAFAGTDFHGLWVLEEGRDVAERVVKSQVGRPIYPIQLAHFDGQTLVGTSSGLWRIPDHSARAERVEGIPTGSVVRRFLPDDRRALIGTWHGLFRLEIGAKKALRLDDSPTDLGVLELAQIDGSVLIGAEKGLWFLQGRSLLKMPIPDEIVIRDLFVSGNQAICGGEAERGNRIDSYWWIWSEGRLTPIVGEVHHDSPFERVTPLFFDGHFFVADRMGLWEVVDSRNPSARNSLAIRRAQAQVPRVSIPNLDPFYASTAPGDASLEH